MKGARRTHGIISSRAEQLPLWDSRTLRNLLQKLCALQCGVGQGGWKQTNKAKQSLIGSHHLCLAQNIFSETITSAKPALARTRLAFQRHENHCADHSYHLPPALPRNQHRDISQHKWSLIPYNRPLWAPAEALREEGQI